MEMSTFDLALNYLTYKPRTEKEIRDYLKKKKIKKDIIENTIEKLKEYNYINDREYVKLYLKNNHLGKRFGLKKIKYDLIKRGISEKTLTIIDQIPEENLNDYCIYHFNKVLSSTDKVPYRKRVPKIVRYLNLRGFDYQDYSSLISEIPKESDIDELKFKKDFEHYYKLYSKKGFNSSELKSRIIRGLLSKGYDYKYINEIINQFELK